MRWILPEIGKAEKNLPTWSLNEWSLIQLHSFNLNLKKSHATQIFVCLKIKKIKLLSFTLHLIPSLNPSGTFLSSAIPPNKDSASLMSNTLTIFPLFSPCTASSGPDSEVPSTVLWPSSQRTTSPPSLFRSPMRAALQHSPQWMRSLLSPLFLLFPLFPPTARQKNRGNPARETDRRGERESGREGEWAEAGREGCED